MIPGEPGLLERLLARVSKPARYVGGEWNQIRKEHGSVDVAFALAFPDIYDIGMSNVGLRILYHVLNGRSDVVAERVFAPWLDMEAEMRANGIPLFSLETQTPVHDFDVLGFSLSYELTYTNVLNMLDLAGIPVLSAERGEDDPIVISGGHGAFNPEPLCDFIDGFVIGEGEEAVLEVAESIKATKGQSREARLLALSRIPGVYVPSLYEIVYDADGAVSYVTPKGDAPFPVTKRVVYDLDSASYPCDGITPWVDTPHDRAALEIMRGCTRGCRFCQAGMITRPVRQRSKEKLMEQAEKLIGQTGYDELSLLSLSSADYDGIATLVRELIDKHSPERVGVSLPSIRADADCIHLAAEIERVRKSGLTLAPEAGTQRLRDVISKNVTEEDLLGAVDAALDHGWRKVKLYFMIGLPTETDEDIAGIGELVRKVVGLARSKKKPLAISVSTSSFVPKPHTPFQWRAQDAPEELYRKIGVLQSAVNIKGVQLSWHDTRTSQLEGVLARGDRRIGQVIMSAWKSGCKFDGWNECFKWDAWRAAFEQHGIDPAFFANRQRNYEETLPWEHIQSGVSKHFMIVQDKLAESGKPFGDCRGAACLNCGIDELLPDEYTCPSRGADV